MDPTQPVYSQVIDKRPDGVYTGYTYVAIGGLTRGHIRLLAADAEALMALAKALMGFAQTQQQKGIEIVPGGALPPNGRN